MPSNTTSPTQTGPIYPKSRANRVPQAGPIFQSRARVSAPAATENEPPAKAFRRVPRSSTACDPKSKKQLSPTSHVPVITHVPEVGHEKLAALQTVVALASEGAAAATAQLRRPHNTRLHVALRPFLAMVISPKSRALDCTPSDRAARSPRALRPDPPHSPRFVTLLGSQKLRRLS